MVKLKVLHQLDLVLHQLELLGPHLLNEGFSLV